MHWSFRVRSELTVQTSASLLERLRMPADAGAWQRLIDLYNAWGKPEKAREYAAIPAMYRAVMDQSSSKPRG